jgi:outer membrane receptor for Fe3+-dicitrate
VAAGTRQLLNTLRLACQLAGIFVDVVTHDTHLETARDAAYLSDPIKYNAAGVATVLGHTYKSQMAGLTEQYIGPQKRDIWSARLQQPQEKDEFGIDIIDSPVPFKQRKHAITEDLQAAAEDLGVDFSTRKGKDLARNHLRTQDKKAFIEKNHNQIDKLRPVQMDSVNLGKQIY